MSTKEKNFYEILGVQQTDSDDTIRKAYKKLAVKNHPDKNKDNPNAEKLFKEISRAYDTLRDKTKREEYDNYIKYGDSKSNSGFENFRQNGGGSNGNGPNFSSHNFDFGNDRGFEFYDNMFKDFFSQHSKFGFNDDDDFFKDFQSGNNTGFSGGGVSTSIKKSTVIKNGVKVTKTEKTTTDSNGNKTVEVTEESGGKTTTSKKQISSGGNNNGGNISNGNSNNNQITVNSNNNMNNMNNMNNFNNMNNINNEFDNDNFGMGMNMNMGGFGGFNNNDPFANDPFFNGGNVNNKKSKKR